MSEGLSKYLEKDKDKSLKFSEGSGLGRYLSDTLRRDDDDTDKK